MATIAAGHTALEKLAKALGMDGRKLRRLNIDVAIDSALTVYAEELIDADQLGSLAGGLQGVEPVRVETPPEVGPSPLLAGEPRPKVVARRSARPSLPDGLSSSGGDVVPLPMASAYEAYNLDDIDGPHVVTTNQAVS